MKSSDIISIVLVAMIGVFASYFIVNMLMGNPDDAYVSYKTIEVIDPGLAEPDAEVFNADAINPTVEVFVGDCEDVDHDGLLSQAELVACGRATALEEEEETEEELPTTDPTDEDTVTKVNTEENTEEEEDTEEDYTEDDFFEDEDTYEESDYEEYDEEEE